MTPSGYRSKSEEKSGICKRTQLTSISGRLQRLVDKKATDAYLGKVGGLIILTEL